MSDAVTLLRQAAIRRAVDGPGKSSTDARRAAFANANVVAASAALVDKIAHAASKITDDDIAAARTAGLSEDEIFEITVCAAYGQALRQLEAGLAALAAATAKTGEGA
jgi:CII-binding regulator of phage lambda lysogenization HflD